MAEEEKGETLKMSVWGLTASNIGRRELRKNLEL